MSQLMMYAWVGEDELGSGKVGLKIGKTPAGMIPLAAMSYHLDLRLGQADAADGSLSRCERSVKIRLMKFVATGEVAAETKAGEWSGI